MAFQSWLPGNRKHENNNLNLRFETLLPIKRWKIVEWYWWYWLGWGRGEEGKSEPYIHLWADFIHLQKIATPSMLTVAFGHRKVIPLCSQYHAQRDHFVSFYKDHGKSGKIQQGKAGNRKHLSKQTSVYLDAGNNLQGKFIGCSLPSARNRKLLFCFLL